MGRLRRLQPPRGTTPMGFRGAGVDIDAPTPSRIALAWLRCLYGSCVDRSNRCRGWSGVVARLKSWLDRRSALGLKGADPDREAARGVFAEFDATVATWTEFRRQCRTERERREAGRDGTPAPGRIQDRGRKQVRREDVYAAVRTT